MLLRASATSDTYQRGAVTSPAILPTSRRRTVQEVAIQDGWSSLPSTDVTALPGPAIQPRPPSSPSSVPFTTDLGGPVMAGSSSIDFGLGPVSISPSGIGGSATIGGVPITVSIPFGGGSEPPTAQPAVPGTGFAAPTSSSAGPCPGIFQVRGPDGTCIDLTALPPGGDPAVVGAISAPSSYADGYGAAVKGYFGVGIMPRVEVQSVRHCPPGTALGKDGVCYKGLGRNSPKRMWPMGEKPLMTGGDRAAIRRAKTVASALLRQRKALKAAGKALEKVGC